MGNTHATHTDVPVRPKGYVPPPLPSLATLPSSVSLVHNKLGSKIFLVGVNHIDPKSCDDVRETIRKVAPDTILIETSGERFSQITYNGNQGIPIVQATPPSVFAQTLFARIQYFAALIMDTRPGAEMRVALNEAKNCHANIILGDRVSNITWERVMCSITLPEIVRAMPTCVRLAHEFTRQRTKEDMKQFLLDNLIDEGPSYDPSKFLFPSAYNALVTEKDKYIASVLRETPGDRIVAVVGKGHIAGITHHLQDKEDPFILRAELGYTTRFRDSPLGRQLALAAGADVAVTTAVAAGIARTFNYLRKDVPNVRPFRRTIPFTMALLTLQLMGGLFWATNEWTKLHVAISYVMLVHYEKEALKTMAENDQKQK